MHLLKSFLFVLVQMLSLFVMVIAVKMSPTDYGSAVLSWIVGFYAGVGLSAVAIELTKN